MAKYPLEPVLAIKKDRVNRAEKVVKEKRRLLELEQEKLQEKEATRDKVKNHYMQKIQQLRELLDEGTTSDAVLQIKAYIKVVAIQLAEEEEKVNKQKEVVLAAAKELEKAEANLAKRRKEEEKTRLHKEAWMKEALKEEARAEEKEQDEMGQLLYQLHQKKQRESGGR
ncbi:type III secretion T3S chaperone [Candidatus Chlamydia sanziniae]|uniref:Type III secretion protein n=1 Tax=Candidatus Chlamydia sanziniae TaxID=1806891 RepID=A0A1A9HWP9_9CHLA|nr:type III secretion T3S chaperone [Candidatus Chlamydia sanziniae]ANH78512.1 Type III secretion protein [Candidatus Chlamydia sanziniae]